MTQHYLISHLAHIFLFNRINYSIIFVQIIIINERFTAYN